MGGNAKNEVGQWGLAEIRDAQLVLRGNTYISPVYSTSTILLESILLLVPRYSMDNALDQPSLTNILECLLPP